ncbi:hypothetical protein CCAX7_60310 [Capsulimonas corticalis]|uniref:Uncharacterized protein n=1 Tax=Capsulimonas corticalis TaxID=2219043 RepID=A0A9N7QE64_9BACT|nr:hypothetical protein CCAX7_60310 [Capsulimonas corticalis]
MPFQFADWDFADVADGRYAELPEPLDELGVQTRKKTHGKLGEDIRFMTLLDHLDMNLGIAVLGSDQCRCARDQLRASQPDRNWHADLVSDGHGEMLHAPHDIWSVELGVTKFGIDRFN